MSTVPPPLLHYLLALESASNILTALPLIFTPGRVLGLILVPSAPLNPAIAHPAALASTPSRAALQLAQYVGAILVALTVPLLYATPDAPSGTSAVARAARAEKGRFRRAVYVSYAVGEAAFVLVFIAQLVRETTTAGTPGAVKPGVLMGGLLMLANLGAVRMWAVVCRGEWFGQEMLAAKAARGETKKKET